MARLVTSAAALLSCAGAAASAETYRFVSVVDSTGPLGGFGGLPTINNGGTVAFGAVRDDGVFGVFTAGGGGPVTPVATSGTFTRFPGTPAINDAGTVAFEAETARGSGIYSGNGGALTTIAETAAGSYSMLFDPSISADGRVSFWSYGADGVYAIRAGSGGPATTIADSRGPLTHFGGSSVNRAGTVAFQGSTTANEGIYTGNGGPVSPVVQQSDGRFGAFYNRPAVNGSGVVAFNARPVDGGFGIYTAGGGPVSEVAHSDSEAVLNFLAPAINDPGTVAFLAIRQGTETMILTGGDPVADRVVGAGDALFGGTVTSVGFGGGGLNDAGTLAFTYFLDNGVSGIALAVVPEPTSAAGALVATAVFAPPKDSDSSGASAVGERAGRGRAA